MYTTTAITSEIREIIIKRNNNPIPANIQYNVQTTTDTGIK